MPNKHKEYPFQDWMPSTWLYITNMFLSMYMYVEMNAYIWIPFF
jgi:hypothetical protein